MQFIDLKTQYALVDQAIKARIEAVLQHGQYIMGPEVAELEERLAEFVGVNYCITLSSGTDALLAAMMALGIGPGDEVITTPFTFIATGEMIALLGARPIFIDIDPVTYNLDPSGLEAAISERTRAIIPVALYGQCADMDAINRIAARYRIPVIEDAAQSFGATYHKRKSCGLSLIGCTSFFPAKPLGAYGDGGACFTNDADLAKILREIRNHGQDRRYHHARLGINGRLDTIQAAILLAKLAIFPEEVEARSRVGNRYSELLNSCGASPTDRPVSNVLTPTIRSECRSVYAQYTIQVEGRDQVAQRLHERQIPTAIHYPIPLNRQPIFRAGSGADTATPICDQIAGRVISLPMHPYLSDDTVEHVAATVASAAGLIHE